MGEKSFKGGLKFNSPFEILQRKEIKRRLKSNPRVKVAIANLINPENHILTEQEVLKFEFSQGLGQAYYGLDVTEETGDLVIQHLYNKSYDGIVPQKSLLKITFSVDNNGNVVEKRECYVINQEDIDSKDFESRNLRKRMIIIYGPYGIEQQLDLIEYEYMNGNLCPNRQYKVTRNKDFPFVANLERKLNLPSGKYFSKQQVLLDEEDFALLVPKKHIEGKKEGSILTKKDLQVLAKNKYIKFEREEDIKKYYEENQESIREAFKNRKSFKFRPYRIGGELIPEETRPSYSDYKSLQSSIVGLRRMAQRAGILEDQEQRTSDELTIG